MVTKHVSKDPEILALTKKINSVTEQIYLLVNRIDETVTLLKQYTEKEENGVKKA